MRRKKDEEQEVDEEAMWITLRRYRQRMGNVDRGRRRWRWRPKQRGQSEMCEDASCELQRTLLRTRLGSFEWPATGLNGLALAWWQLQQCCMLHIFSSERFAAIVDRLWMGPISLFYCRLYFYFIVTSALLAASYITHHSDPCFGEGHLALDAGGVTAGRGCDCPGEPVSICCGVDHGNLHLRTIEYSRWRMARRLRRPCSAERNWRGTRSKLQQHGQMRGEISVREIYRPKMEW
mmetsp:Transcript_34433/g.83302  ORF Transcript_34433/g.83302 Transcript_34433/m.83302 type:complete len:235 (-) Transcript_34433:1051-1755(-)